MSYENSNLRQNNEIWRCAANIYYAWPSNLCREGASAGGPPEAQAPQPKAAALVFSMYSLEDNCLNCWSTLRTKGLQQQAWRKTCISLWCFIHFEQAWIPNTHVTTSFLIFWSWIAIKPTYYWNLIFRAFLVSSVGVLKSWSMAVHATR